MSYLICQGVSASSPTERGSDGSNGDSSFVIVGSVFGVLILLVLSAILAVQLIRICRRKRKHRVIHGNLIVSQILMHQNL